MNNRQKNELQHELRAVGATNKEMSELVNIASNLGRLARENGQALWQRPEQQCHKIKTLLMFAIPSLSGLAIGMALIIVSQAALPGSLLYPLQKVSDSVSISLDPSYTGMIMMKRAEQVRQLVSDHASSSLVLATLADYQTEASGYKHTASHYAAFEYCERNLQEASTMATAAERQAIHTTLVSFNDM